MTLYVGDDWSEDHHDVHLTLTPALMGYDQ